MGLLLRDSPTQAERSDSHHRDSDILCLCLLHNYITSYSIDSHTLQEGGRGTSKTQNFLFHSKELGCEPSPKAVNVLQSRCQ